MRLLYFILTFFIALIYIHPPVQAYQTTYIIQTSKVEIIKEKYPDVQFIHQITDLDLYEISFNSSDTLKQLQLDPLVVRLEENKAVHLPPNEELVSARRSFTASTSPSWGYGSMSFPTQLYGHNPVTIAVLDTGADLTHPDLSRFLMKGYNTLNNSDPQDDNGHGTHVTGIITWGMPDSLRIIPIKVLDSEGYGTLFSVVEGIHYAIDQGVDVINMSFGFNEDEPLVKEAVQKAVDSGIFMVAAAGNYATTPILYPARYDDVIAVSAYDERGRIAWFSQYGNDVDFTAPGTSIYSTYMGNGYKTQSGTSMATPFITRALGVLKIENPYLDNKSWFRILQDSTIDLGTTGFDPYFGYGKVNVEEALHHSFDQNQDDMVDLQDLINLGKKGNAQEHVLYYYGR